MSLLSATLWIIALTFIPALELRFSIPVGILAGTMHIPFFGDVQGLGLSPWYVFTIAVLANIALAALFYLFLATIVRWLRAHWTWFSGVYDRQVERVQKRIHDKVERWGWLGLALFIGVPLPGSGVYTGAVAAYGLGMSFRRFMIASILGVLIAGTAVLILTLGVKQALGFF